MEYKNINLKWSYKIVELFATNAITQFYISPGARNAPLIKILEDSAQSLQLTLHSVLDERNASFMALGYAKNSGKPAVIVTTSGSALGNIFPGVIEAYQSKVPMIILTADRPSTELFHQSNQAIFQENIFGSYTPNILNLPTAYNSISLRPYLSKVQHTLASLNTPFHINMPFDMPLISERPIDLSKDKDATQFSLNINLALDQVATPLTMQKLILIIGDKSKVEKEILEQFIQKFQVPYYCDILSNYKYSLTDKVEHLHIQSFEDRTTIEYIDSSFQPQCLLHLGERYTSKQLFLYLKKNPSIKHLQIATEEYTDSGHSLDYHFDIDPNMLLRERISKVNVLSIKEITIPATVVSQKEGGVWSWPALVKAFFKIELGEQNVFLGNSTCIRAFDFIGTSFSCKHLFWGNRGTSGIDGLISTALGLHQSKSEKPTTAIIGDISFLHNLNALIEMAYLSDKRAFILIVVNNNGGGIFHHLNWGKNRKFCERYIDTPHSFTFESLAKSFDLEYCTPQSPKQFKKSYLNFHQQNQKAIIEITLNQEEDIQSWNKHNIQF